MYDFFLRMVSFFWIPLIFVVFTAVFWTLTDIFFLYPLRSVMVIVAFPSFFAALIFPEEFTFTIFLLLEVQDAILSPFASPVTFSFVVLWPLLKTILDAFTDMVGRNLARWFVSFLPHRVQVLSWLPYASAVASWTVFIDPSHLWFSITKVISFIPK